MSQFAEFAIAELEGERETIALLRANAEAEFERAIARCGKASEKYTELNKRYREIEAEIERYQAELRGAKS